MLYATNNALISSSQTKEIHQLTRMSVPVTAEFHGKLVEELKKKSRKRKSNNNEVQSNHVIKIMLREERERKGKREFITTKRRSVES